MCSSVFYVIARVFPSGLYLRTGFAGFPEKLVELIKKHVSAKNRDKYLFHASDDIRTISLITIFILRIGILGDLFIRGCFYKGSQIREEKVNVKLLLNRDGGSAVEFLQHGLIL